MKKTAKTKEKSRQKPWKKISEEERYSVEYRSSFGYKPVTDCNRFVIFMRLTFVYRHGMLRWKVDKCIPKEVPL